MQLNEIFTTAIEEWRTNKGIGTAFVPTTLNDKIMVLGVLQGIYSRSPTCSTLIVVDSFGERTDLVEFLTNQEDDNGNNDEFKRLINNKNIKILTSDFIEKRFHTVSPFICILYRVSKLNTEVSYLFKNSRFKLAIINKFLATSDENALLYKEAPVLKCFSNEVLQQARMSTPVEEMVIPLELDADSEDSKLLKHYNEYITTSLNIFNSFDVIHKAYAGDKENNISSVTICNNIAKENGWSDNLDMSVEYNRQIDELYNPISIKERAFNTYEMIRLRQNLIVSNKIKLKAILDFVNEHKDEKILIVSKRSQFAKEVTDYINNLSETNICGDYHDCLEPIPATTIDGAAIYVKSGKNKGERKMMASQRQKTLNVEKFKRGDIRVLSTNATPNRDLDIKIDCILFSSTTCPNLKATIYRLDKLKLPDSLKMGLIYIKGTQEEKALADFELTLNSSNDKNNKNDDERINKTDFVIAD